MSTQENLVRLNKLFSVLQAEVKNETAASFSDIKNVLSELFLVEPLKLALNLPGLVSLNAAEQRNFPAVDLADDSQRVAIQVTATTTAAKIKKTLRTFHDHKLYDRFDTLYIVILGDKKNYRVSLEGLSEDKFKFGSDTVLDISDIYTKLTQVSDQSSLKNVVELLQTKLIGGEILPSMRESVVETDLLHTNLLPINLPSMISRALLTLDKSKIEALVPEGGKKPRYERDYARILLEHYEIPMSRDFHCHKGALLTFKHIDLEAVKNIGLIDVSTFEKITPKEFYTSSLDHEIQFRFMLRRSLQYQLMKTDVFWQHDERMFAFQSKGNFETRVESWIGQKAAKRDVFVKMKQDDETGPPVYKQFGFRVQFKCVNDSWYLVTEPKWLFTRNGYEKSYAHPKLAAKTATMEKNGSIYQHTRFISWYLTNKLDDDENALKFGKNIVVTSETAVQDKAWTNRNEVD